MPLPTFFTTRQLAVQRALDLVVPAGAPAPPPVVAAMRDTLLASSKHVRAVLVLLAAELCGDATDALPAAAAVECVHAASLILDDLPCMDNASLRRGRPAAHIAHGEAVAILAAFGLLNQAFGHLARSYDAPLARRLVDLYSNAIGLEGLVAGQAEDVIATSRPLDFQTLERIHRRKTGVLFSAAATAGAMIAGAPRDAIDALAAYAKNLGLAFQIVDDLLDVIGDPRETGKAVRTDARKTTFVSFSGVEGARELAAELCRTAELALTPFGSRAAPLCELAAFVAERRL